MRLFFAAAVTAEARLSAARCIETLASLCPDVKWVEPENLHVTLRFLGETSPDRLPALEGALRAAARSSAPIDLEFDRFGCFGSKSRPGSVWAGIGRGEPAVRRLADALDGSLKALGFPERDAAFRAHMTLGRPRSPGAAAALAQALRETPAPSWPCRVDAAVLWESRLSARGPRYSPMAEAVLG